MSLPFQNQVNLLVTLLEIKKFSAIGIISEIGTDKSWFKSSKYLSSWAGLTPQNNESDGKKKSVRISRDVVYIKPLLVQCELASIKSKDCSYFRFKYESIKNVKIIKEPLLLLPVGW